MRLQHLQNLIRGCVVGLFVGLSANVPADDTEIFFLGTQQLINGGGAPNILLGLDTSGSMSNRVDAKDSKSPSRFAAMKEATINLIEGLRSSGSRVNLGLMRFTDPGGAILYPVSDLNAPAPDVNTETVTAVPVESRDDAEELEDTEVVTITNNSMFTSNGDLAGRLLALGNTFKATYQVATSGNADEVDQEESLSDGAIQAGGSQWDISNAQINGVRFFGLGSAGLSSTDEDAVSAVTIDFTARSDSNNTSGTVVFTGQAAADPSLFASAPALSVSSRPDTAASARWSSVPPFVAGSVYSSADLINIFIEQRDTWSWSGNNALVYFAQTATGTSGGFQRAPHRHRNASASERMRLKVSVGTPTAVGIRFRNVGIPQGAKIVKASIVFTAAPHPHTDAVRDTSQASEPLINPIEQTAPVSLKIFGEKSVKPCFFASTGTSQPLAAECDIASSKTGGVLSRPRTAASVTWSPGAWTPDLTYGTADISTVVQELVDDTDFCGGNDMALLLLQEEGPGQRLAYSSEDGGRAPVLEVEYDPSDLGSAGKGCIKQTTARTVQTTKDLYGVRTDSTVIGTNAVTGDFIFLRSNYEFAALRFSNLSLPRGAQAEAATVTLNIKPTANQNKGEFTVRVRGELAGDSEEFTTNATELRSRKRTAAQAEISFDLTGKTSVQLAGLQEIIKEVVGQSTWSSGNALTLFFDVLKAPSRAVIHSPVSSSALSPSLQVTLSAANEAPQLLNADALLSVVNRMTNPNWTPLVGQAYEAALYFRGESVLHGKRLGHLAPDSTVLSHPRSWTGGTLSPEGCSIDGVGAPRCKTIEGNPVYKSPIQNECGPNHFVLLTDGEANHNGNDDGVDHGRSKAEAFVGGKCQSAKQDADPTAKEKVYASRNVPGNEMCGRDIAFKLSRPDPQDAASLAKPPEKRRQVKTHTIAFNLDDPNDKGYLDDVAANGGTGEARTASTALQLLKVFEEIVADVSDDPSSFAAAATSVNTFNRLRNRDDVYFSLFQPSEAPIWRGNVKRYRVIGDEIVGRNCVAAVDDRGNFRTDSVSFWSSVTDGNVLEKGGTVGRQVTVEGGAINPVGTYSPDDRKVYTFLGAYQELKPNANPELAGAKMDLLPDSFDELSNGDKTKLTAAFGAADANDAADLFDWLRGKDARTETVKLRYPFGDPLHASPVVVSLGGTEKNPVEIVIAATNDGGIRWLRAGKSPDASNKCTASADDGIGGVELGAFYPREQLAKQKTMRDVLEGKRVYTLDSTPQVWRVDVDGDGQIERSQGDFVRLIFGERDGGDRYYAIDITPSFNLTSTTNPDDLKPESFDPRVLWKIDGSPDDSGETTQYADLGLTWSEPVIRFMRFNDDPEGAVRTVLIFGGGNDPRFDREYIKLSDADVVSEDPKGNIVYVADAHSGKVLTSIGGKNTDADLKIPGMNYPIPSSIATMNTSGSSVDRLYFGDVGGNLWRVDFRSTLIKKTSTGGEVATVGHLANVSKAQTAAEKEEFLPAGDSGAHGVDTRKFYYPPAIVRQNSTSYSEQGRHTVLLLGTGSRANPRNIVTEDHFYAFRDLHEERLVSVGETASSPGEGIAVKYPRRQKNATNAATTSPIGGDAGAEFGTDLFDVTDNRFQAANKKSVDAKPVSKQDIADFQKSLGWYIRLPELVTTDTVPDPKNPNGPLISGKATHLGEKVLNPATVGLGIVFFSAYTPEPANSVSQSCRTGVGFTRVYALDLATAGAVIPEFGDPNTSTSTAASVLTGDDRSAPDTLTGNPGGSTLINTDTLKLITGTKVNDLGQVVPERTFWFQRQ